MGFLQCALKRLLKNQAWELEAITHYKSCKYHIQCKPTWYHSSPLLFCCASISPKSLQYSTEGPCKLLCYFRDHFCQQPFVRTQTHRFIRRIYSIFRHRISYLSTVKHLFLEMAQQHAGDSYMQPPYQPIHVICTNLLEMIYFEIRKKNVRPKIRPRFSLYKILLEPLVLSD